MQEAGAPESCAQPRQPPPAAEGSPLTLQTTRVPLLASPRRAEQARLLPSPTRAAPRPERPPLRGAAGANHAAAAPLPRAMGLNAGHRRQGRPPGPELAAPPCEAVPCVPTAAARAMPWAGTTDPGGARRGEKLAPSPGLPLRRQRSGSRNSVCSRSCGQWPGTAPATRVGAGTLRCTRRGLASQERAKGPSPSPPAARPPPSP